MGKVNGIVLREMKYKENSKILTVYTKEYGKISIMARGANNPKSRLIANTQVFSYNEFQIYKGKSFYYLQEAYLIDSFYNIRDNIDKLVYGSYILELMDKSMEDQEPNDRAFALLEKGLSSLAALKDNYLKFITAYELKFISFLGYRPCIETCVSCNQVSLGLKKFSIREGGILCSHCSNKDLFAPKLSENQYRSMCELLYVKFEDLDKLPYDDGTVEMVHNLLVDYILVNIDRKKFNSLNIFDTFHDF